MDYGPLTPTSTSGISPLVGSSSKRGGQAPAQNMYMHAGCLPSLVCGSWGKPPRRGSMFASRLVCLFRQSVQQAKKSGRLSDE